LIWQKYRSRFLKITLTIARGAGESVEPRVERSGTPGTVKARHRSLRSSREPNICCKRCRPLLGLTLCYVAERRLNLARPLKAGIQINKIFSSRQRRLNIQSSLTRRNPREPSSIPALRGRAKFMPTLRVEDHLLPRLSANTCSAGQESMSTRILPCRRSRGCFGF